MLDLRDAILAADAIRNPSGDPGGSLNHCRIWEVFATRGMGAAAQDTDDTGSASVVEDFTVAPECPALPAPAICHGHGTAGNGHRSGPAGRVVPPVAHRRHVERAHGLFHRAGSAAPGSDYVALPASAQFPPGAATVDVAVTPIDDTRRRVQRDRRADVDWAASAIRSGTPSAATVTIVSDDVAPDLVGVGADGADDRRRRRGHHGFGDRRRTRGPGRRQRPPRATTCRRIRPWTRSDVRARVEQPIGTLAPSARSSRLRRSRSPPGTATGTYYVLAQADADSVLSETSETNNVRSAQIRVGPDLTSRPSPRRRSPRPAARITVTDTTKNIGGGSAAPR